MHSKRIYNKDDSDDMDDIDDINADDVDNAKYLEIYGISQNPDTKDYIMILQDGYCEKCGKEYTDAESKWCKPCQISYLKFFTNWSGTEEIDNFIQEMQLSINDYNDKVLEWIPYIQFKKIKKVSATVYLAIWTSGPLYFNNDKKELIRESNKKVALKCLYNSQNTTDEFLNKV